MSFSVKVTSPFHQFSCIPADIAMYLLHNVLCLPCILSQSCWFFFCQTAQRRFLDPKTILQVQTNDCSMHAKKIVAYPRTVQEAGRSHCLWDFFQLQEGSYIPGAQKTACPAQHVRSHVIMQWGHRFGTDTLQTLADLCRVSACFCLDSQFERRPWSGPKVVRLLCMAQWLVGVQPKISWFESSFVQISRRTGGLLTPCSWQPKKRGTTERERERERR